MTHLLFNRSFAALVMMLGALSLTACGSTQTSGTDAPVTQKEDTALKIDRVIEKALNEAQAQGDTAQTLALLDKAHKRNPDNAALAVRYARVLREDEQMNRARLILKPLTDTDIPHQPALTEMAMVNLGLGNYSQAEKYARNAALLNDADGRAYLALGTALDAQGEHAQAEDAFRTGLGQWQGDPAPILNNLALNLAAQGKVSEALSVLERARELSPRRMEIERNFRIISTLNETVGPRIPKPPRKPEILLRKERQAQAEVQKQETAENKKPEETPEEAADTAPAEQKKSSFSGPSAGND